MGILTDMLSRRLPRSLEPVVVSGTWGVAPEAEAEGVRYHRLPDRRDRLLYGTLSRLQGLVPGMHRNYHFRAYFHRSYARRAAALLAREGVEAVVFPLYPQWAPLFRARNPDARLRSRRVYVATAIGLASGGLLLQGLETPIDATHSGASTLPGFALVFALAGAARLVSCVLLIATPEPSFRGLTGGRRALRYLRTGRGELAWRLLLVGAFLQLTTYLASPFFAPFMLEQLRFSYTEYMIASLTVVAGKSAILPRWGSVLDDVGSRRGYALAAVLAALVPLPWLWANGLAWVVVAQLFSGIAWATYEVSFFTVLLDASYRRTRPQVFAAQNILNGLAQLIGSSLGGVLLGLADRRFVVVFAVSLLARLSVALSIPRLIPRLQVPPRARRSLALRMIGLRAHGGPVHRPVLSERGPDR